MPAQAAEQGGADAARIAAIDAAAARLGRQAKLPEILSATDVETYRGIIDAQANGRWVQADRLIAKLRDPLLVGPLLARRYLETGYKAEGRELVDWLKAYGDQANAPDIYRLARSRLGGKAAGPNPAGAAQAGSKDRWSEEDEATWGSFFTETPARSLSAAEKRKVSARVERIRALVRDDQLDAAAAMVEAADTALLLGETDQDRMRSYLAFGMFGDGRDQDALAWAAKAIERSGEALPQAHWVTGLALWRSGKKAEAARHFEAVANSRDVTPWMTSAGAYWASRAYLVAKRPDLVNHWLRVAATNPRAFYGLLARRSLGQDIYYSWETRPFTDLDVDILMRVPAARRSLAFIQLGDQSHAEEEVQILVERAAPSLSQSLLALAQAGNLPGLAVRLGDSAGQDRGRVIDSATYPVPDWRPSSGWSVDRALVLAIALQESGFDPRAKSPSGAVGLMQLMPRTAKAMGGGGRLTDPQHNLELGQRYVKALFDDPQIRGNLLLMAAAYNSGQGTVSRWLQTVRHGGDALMFMESIPSSETRSFVAHVMTNYWAYSNRLGQPAPSIDAIAAGDWPMYDAAIARTMAVKNGRN